MNEGINKDEIVNKTEGAEVVKANSEQSIGDSVKSAQAEMDKAVEELKKDTAEKLAKLENNEGISTLNINNPSIIEIMAKIAGCEVKNINTSAFETVKSMAKQGKSATWDVGASTFIVLDESDIANMQLKSKKPGDMILANANNVTNVQRNRANEIGM
jgi:hypothetical protein